MSCQLNSTSHLVFFIPEVIVLSGVYRQPNAAVHGKNMKGVGPLMVCVKRGPHTGSVFICKGGVGLKWILHFRL